MVMPAGIGREELRTLTGQGAQLAEVLPAEEYAWAHLPGAVSLQLQELDALAGQLDPVPAGDPGSFDAALGQLADRVARPTPRLAAVS
jgi:rhodanese-related sulfurtransferase